jgi:hypothetical protein
MFGASQVEIVDCSGEAGRNRAQETMRDAEQSLVFQSRDFPSANLSNQA